MSPTVISLGAAQNTSYLGCHGGRCYNLVKTVIYFRQAGAKCASLPQGSGHVASIPDADTAVYLVGQLSRYGVEPIIGGVDVRGPWKWTTGQRYYGRSLIEYYIYIDIIYYIAEGPSDKGRNSLSVVINLQQNLNVFLAASICFSLCSCISDVPQSPTCHSSYVPVFQT